MLKANTPAIDRTVHWLRHLLTSCLMRWLERRGSLAHAFFLCGLVLTQGCGVIPELDCEDGSKSKSTASSSNSLQFVASAAENLWLTTLGNGQSLVQALKNECRAHGGSKVLVATVDGKPRRFAITNALGPIDLIFIDVNGDGISDAASANEHTNNIAIYLGKTDGSFSASTEFPTGIRPQRLQAGDFNNDGHIDLVTANLGDPFAGVGDVSLLLGDGSGGGCRAAVACHRQITFRCRGGRFQWRR